MIFVFTFKLTLCVVDLHLHLTSLHLASVSNYICMADPSIIRRCLLDGWIMHSTQCDNQSREFKIGITACMFYLAYSHWCARAHATKFHHKRNGSTNQLHGFQCFRLENVLQLAHVACCTTRIFDRALGLQSLCRVTV